MTQYDRTALKSGHELNQSACAKWAYEKWEQFNRQYFEFSLRPGPIEWGVPPEGHKLGFFDSTRNLILLSVNLVNSKDQEWQSGSLYGERFTADVLLHEMIHQSIHQKHFMEEGFEALEHDQSHWSDEVSRVHKILTGEELHEPFQEQASGPQYLAVAAKNQNPPRSLIARWPYSIRPGGYYEQAAIQRFGRMATI